MDYRKSFIRGLVALTGLSGLVAVTMAQQQPGPVEIKALKGGVYYTQGGVGGNSGIIVGQNGVIVIDAKTTPESAKDMFGKIARLTPKAVTHVILTHSDLDHVNGLAAFPVGITIIAHENNKKEQDTALRAGGRGAPPADHQPTQTVTKNKESVTLDGVKFTLLHWAPAHTSGDLVVYLPDQKICSTGDLIVTNRADDNPNIHFEKNELVLHGRCPARRENVNYVANEYGYDKASLHEREIFADQNLERIYDSASNPLSGSRWWLEAEDPALASTTQPPADGKSLAMPTIQHAPSYLMRQPSLREMPPAPPDPAIPSARPPAPVAPLAAPTRPVTKIAPTIVRLSPELETLGAMQSPEIKFRASGRESPSAAQFRVAVDENGAVRYCFLENSSGDAALDEQARKYLALSRFSPIENRKSKIENGFAWGTAMVEWGNDIVAPSPATESAIP